MFNNKSVQLICSISQLSQSVCQSAQQNMTAEIVICHQYFFLIFFNKLGSERLMIICEKQLITTYLILLQKEKSKY